MLSTKSQSPIEIGWPSGKAAGTGRLHPADRRALMELALKLNHADTLRSVTDTVGNYCGKALGIPAGMIFGKRNKDLQLISWGGSPNNPPKQLGEEGIKKGPVGPAFRTGEPMFW